MTEQEKAEIIAEVERRIDEKYKGVVVREDTQSRLAEPRKKWFRDNNGSGQKSLMAVALGSSITSWAVWEKIRTLTCYICGKSYVRQLTDEDGAEDIAEKLCQLIYDLASGKERV